MAQSLGNMVACEALRQGLQVGKYFMFDAAVPSEAIDASLQDDGAATRAKYVPDDWRSYPTFEESDAAEMTNPNATEDELIVFPPYAP